MERVVDEALAVGLGVPGGQAVLHHLAGALDGEVDDRRRAAEGRRPGAGVEGVAGGGAAERQLHVRVRVDPARDHVLAGRVDDLAPAAAGRGDPARTTAAIVSPSTSTSAAIRAGRADDRSALNEKCHGVASRLHQVCRTRRGGGRGRTPSGRAPRRAGPGRGRGRSARARARRRPRRRTCPPGRRSRTCRRSRCHRGPRCRRG